MQRRRLSDLWISGPRRRSRLRPAGLRRLSPAWLLSPLLAAALAGCVSAEDYNRAVSDRDRWRASVRVLEGENRKVREALDEWIKAHNALQERLKTLPPQRPPAGPPKEGREEVGRLKQSVEKYERETANLEAQVQRLTEDRDAYRNWYQIYRERFSQALLREQRLQRKSKVYERMVKNLEKEVSQGQLKLQEIQGRLTVSVLDKIVFDAGGVDINPAGKAVLDKLANLLKGITDKRIQVEGHTDNLPVRPTAGRRYRDNWELSALRAAAVVRYLQEAGGMDPTLLSAVGYGPFQPVATNDTPEGRRKNRRIEIVLTPLPKKTISDAAAPEGAAPRGPEPSPPKPE